jgi:hypothetical protein
MKPKIYCVEVNKKGFDKVLMKDLQNMIGWIEPPEKKGEPWTVTMLDGSFFDCKTQESDTILSSIEEVKALLMQQQ